MRRALPTALALVLAASLVCPWALAASGGVPSGQAVESAARQAAREALDGLIAQYKKEHGVE